MNKFILLIVFFSLSTQAQESFKPMNDQEKQITVGLSALAFWTMFSSGGVEEEPNWASPFPGDEAVTNLLGVKTATAANSAKTWSDWGLSAMVLTPIVFPGNSGGEGRWQVMQSFSITALSTAAVKVLGGRQRPYVSQCRDNKIGQDCFSSYRNGSFFSGHASFAFTGAGLMCAFRADAMCPIGLAVAAAVATLRIVSHQHYLSDVAVGGIVGWASGYYLSKWRMPDSARDGASNAAFGYQISFPIP